MDSASLRIKPYDTPEDEKHPRVVHSSPYHESYSSSNNNNNNNNADASDRKEMEPSVDVQVQAQARQQPSPHAVDGEPPQVLNEQDENLDDTHRRSFPRSFYHMKAVPPSPIHAIKVSSGGTVDDANQQSFDSKQSASPQPSFISTDDGSDTQSHDRLNPHIFHPHSSPYHHRGRSTGNSHHHSNGRALSMPHAALNTSRGSKHNASTTDLLQRRVQQLEQDILSKNIQHDIMVNKEEMMTKRIKTKDVRIKNLQSDIHKMRDELESKNETHDKLVDELQSMQQQHQHAMDDTHAQKQQQQQQQQCEDGRVMREMMQRLQENVLDMTADLTHMKQAQNESQMQTQAMNLSDSDSAKQEELASLITKSVQSCLSPVMDQIKQQQREFSTSVQTGQDEWMSSLREQVRSNQEVLETNLKSVEQHTQRQDALYSQNLEHHMSLTSQKLDEMDATQKQQHTQLYQQLKKQDAKLEAVNGAFLQSLFDAAHKSQQQSLEVCVNATKQDLKRELFSAKTEICSTVKKSKNETDSSLNSISQGLTSMHSSLKYEIKHKPIAAAAGGGAGGHSHQPRNSDSQSAAQQQQQQQQTLFASQLIEKYQETMSAQSDMINQNSLKLDNLHESIAALNSEHASMTSALRSNSTSQKLKMEEISTEIVKKTETAFKSLEPLFNELCEWFQKTHGEMMENVKQNRSDMNHSFHKYNTEFKTLIQSVLCEQQQQQQSSSASSSTPSKAAAEYAKLMKEMKALRTDLSLSASVSKHKSDSSDAADGAELAKLSKYMQQMTRRHDELVKVITNTLPQSMDKMKADSAKLGDICHDLASEIKHLQTWYTDNTNANANATKLATTASTATDTKLSPQKHLNHLTHSKHKSVATMAAEEQIVHSMKAMIVQQIEATKKGWQCMDGKVQQQIERVLQQINSSNVAMANNLKSMHDAYQQRIVDACQLNAQTRMQTHEKVLKTHLQQISKNLGDLHQSQLTINMAFQQQHPTQLVSVPDSPIPPLHAMTTTMTTTAVSDHKQMSPASASPSMFNTQPHSPLQQWMETQLAEHFSKLKQLITASSRAAPVPVCPSPPPPPLYYDRDASTKQSKETQRELKELKQYVLNELSKELTRVCNFVKDVHGKMEQLPHKMAYKKDVQQLERTLTQFMAQMQQHKQQQSRVSAKTVAMMTPIRSTRYGVSSQPPQQQQQATTTATATMGAGVDSIDQFMNVLLVRFTDWLGDILFKVNPSRCSIYTLLFVLSKVAFTTFIQSTPMAIQGDCAPDGDEEEKKERVDSGDGGAGGHLDMSSNLSQIQMWALSEMNRIESELENDELELAGTVQRVMSGLQNMMTGDQTFEKVSNDVWLPRPGHSMEYICNQEVRINQRLSFLKDKMQLLLRSHTAVFDKQNVCKIASAVLVLFVVVTAGLVAKVWTEENPMW